jgi:hypothetical protein
MNNFYSERASKAADLFVGTKGYGEQVKAVIAHEHEFSAMLTTERQQKLYLELDDENSDLAADINREIYKAGFLDGIALGFIGATHFDEIAATDRESFHAGYVDGKAGNNRCG